MTNRRVPSFGRTALQGDLEISIANWLRPDHASSVDLIEKTVSGSQTGADRAALDWAIAPAGMATVCAPYEYPRRSHSD
jgi:hypothetical protein